MIIGLTGGIGAGKSTAADFFEEAGWRVIDCDMIVRTLLSEDEPVITALRRRFGKTVIKPSGEVDRKQLGRIVFDDSQSLAWLEELLHPLVLEDWRKQVNAAPGEKWLVQIPLLFEKKLEKFVDLSVCIAVDSSVQLLRLSRRGFPEEEARKRISKQFSLEIKLELADFILLNDGSSRFLREQIFYLVDQLHQRSGATR